jgi:arylsulfatase
MTTPKCDGIPDPSQTPGFTGTIALDVRNSKEDWTPYLAPKPPKDSPKPNILFVLFDDTGLGAWEPFGGRIKMPCLEKIAANGLRYTQWHTAALCSPTRGMLLTGRNHHLNGNASITEGANGFPGQHARMPDECATVAQILQDAGWSTFWVGKNHNVPETDVALGSTKKQWPLAKGFDRFYGFIGGETNQFFPDLIADNHPVEQPYVDGYHLSADLADQAIQMIKDQQASNPSKPWYMWFCPGANHAPHQILKPKETIDEYGYTGAFDDGYEAYRESVLKEMKNKGILPQRTELTPLNPLPDDVANENDEVLPWDRLEDEDDEARAQRQKLFAKLMEVYAAFSTYTDEQVNRIYEYLEKTGQLDNTLIIWAADNGASGEGSPNGSVNENKFFNGYPDTLEENLNTVEQIGGLDGLGGPNTYEHYPTGWAAATSTPFKMFKRYSQYAGGTCDPLVISWPTRIKVKEGGEIRHQYHHAVDIVPTILEACGLEMPKVYRGVKQYDLSGVSMVYTFDAEPDAPTRKERQYYAMLGTRGIWEDGWKAACLHAPLSGNGKFDEDQWELYHVDEDRSESNNLADKSEYKDKLEYLVNAWFEEAKKNLVLPLDDRSAVEQANVVRPTEEGPRDSYTYYPGTAAVPESVAVSIRGHSYTIRAEVTVAKPKEQGVQVQLPCRGVIFAHGSRFGGHTLFIKDKKLYYVYNFLGIEEQKFVSDELDLDPGESYTFIVDFRMSKMAGEHGESMGATKLSVNDKVVAEGPMKAQVGKFTLCGDGLCVGYDSADAVSKEYNGQNPFKGGTIEQVVITPDGEHRGNKPQLFAAAFAAD